MATARDRCAGVLFGLAAGDKNGGPIRMAVLLAESIISSRGYNVEHVVETYNKWYLGKDTEKCFDTGGTFYGVFSAMKKVCSCHFFLNTFNTVLTLLID